MSKLHELLAVESNLKGQADKTRNELKSTFEKKPHLFAQKLSVFQSTDEGVPPATEEQLDLQTSVAQELKWLSGILAPALNTSYAVAEGNTVARADVKIGEKVILQAVPATALLELEKRVSELHDLIGSIKTLDPAKGFKPDTDKGAGIYKAREDVRTRTKKIVKPIVLYPATTEHPAQTQLITEDVEAGKLRVNEWSGLITPSEKAEMLERAETLRRAIKQARARANETEVSTKPAIGEKILSFVFGQ